MTKNISLQDKADKFWEKAHAENLYEKDKFKEVEAGFYALLEKTNPKDIDSTLNSLQSIFEERDLLLRQYKNVVRQELEIRKAELNPGKLEMRAVLNQIKKQIPMRDADENSAGWKASEDGYGDYAGSNKWSFLGGSHAEIDAIRKSTKTREHITKAVPNAKYKSNVFNTKLCVLDDTKVNDAKLKALLEDGRKLTLKEENSFRSRDKYSDALDAMKKTAIAGVKSATGSLVGPKTLASETAQYQKWIDHRNKVIADKLLPEFRTGSGLDSSVGSLSHLKNRQKEIERLQFSPHPEEVALYHRMKDLIQNQIEAAEKQGYSDVMKLEQSLNALNDETLEELQKFTDAEGEDFKWQLLCALAIVAPFAPGVAVVGPLFSYLDIASQIFGPILTDGGGFAEGFVSIMTNPAFGPASEFVKLIKLDEGALILLEETPILSEITGSDGLITALTRNEIVTGFMQTAAPLVATGAPLPYIGIAAASTSVQGVRATSRALEKNEAIHGKRRSSDQNASDARFKSSDGQRERLKNTAEEFTQYRKNVKYVEAAKCAKQNLEQELLIERDIKMAEYFTGQEGSKRLENLMGKDKAEKLKSPKDILEFFYAPNSDRVITNHMSNAMSSIIPEIDKNFIRSKAEKMGITSKESEPKAGSSEKEQEEQMNKINADLKKKIITANSRKMLVQSGEYGDVSFDQNHFGKMKETSFDNMRLEKPTPSPIPNKNESLKLEGKKPLFPKVKGEQNASSQGISAA